MGYQCQRCRPDKDQALIICSDLNLGRGGDGRGRIGENHAMNCIADPD